MYAFVKKYYILQLMSVIWYKTCVACFQPQVQYSNVNSFNEIDHDPFSRLHLQFVNDVLTLFPLNFLNLLMVYFR